MLVVKPLLSVQASPSGPGQASRGDPCVFCLSAPPPVHCSDHLPLPGIPGLARVAGVSQGLYRGHPARDGPSSPLGARPALPLPLLLLLLSPAPGWHIPRSHPSHRLWRWDGHRNHGIMEWFGSGETLKILSLQPPAMGRAPQTRAQVPHPAWSSWIPQDGGCSSGWQSLQVTPRAPCR